MPVLSYKAALIPAVLSGDKFHTIRFGSRVWRPGQSAIHATGVRTSAYRELRRDTVTSVHRIIINDGSVYLDGVFLSADAIAALAVNDGFTGPREFFHFFRQTKTLSTIGKLIQWRTPPFDYHALTLKTATA